MSANFGGVQYLPLAKVCDFYDIEYKWDSLVRTATIEKIGKRIVLRSGSGTVLVDGEKKYLDQSTELNNGTLYVPVSFVRSYMGMLIGKAPAPEPRPVPEGPKIFTIKTIVLDPGHGGKDGGATGRRYRTREKEMALKLALKVKNILEDNGIRIIMTRSDDRFIPLEKRSDVANRSGADLFVSIHINASRSRSLGGFECYFLSNATDDNARALEALENSSLKLGESATAERSNQLDKTLWDMSLTENRMESSELAGHICDSVGRNVAMSNRGIRTARFYVLKYTNIPAVLVEAGYISNRYEETKIRDPKFLDSMAGAVANGILEYKKEYEITEGFTRS
jgi:N-acetylmuramoyl-L-alanine amidase